MTNTLPPEELVDLTTEISLDIEDLTNIAARLKLMQRSIIKWYCQVEGGTVREVAQLFGVPKSTLHNWASQDNTWSFGQCTSPSTSN